MGFDAKIQALRKQRKLSQEKLAEMIGVSRQSVAKWELGSTYPEVDKLIKLSNLFGVSLDKLLKDIEDECSKKDLGTIKKANAEVIRFLCRAKKATYAGGGRGVESSRPYSHDSAHSEGKYKYIDTYLGSERFIGEEAIWIEDVPYWGMNYAGRVLEEGFSGAFLKEVLLAVTEAYPYRGPLVYQKGDYKYHCIVNGAFEWFSGYEEIYLNDKKIYECMFHGGIIA